MTRDPDWRGDLDARRGAPGPAHPIMFAVVQWLIRALNPHPIRRRLYPVQRWALLNHYQHECRRAVMATMQGYRTARTPKACDDYPRCSRGIRPGERYLRAVATPHDIEVNQSDHWWTLNICCEHMPPEPVEASHYQHQHGGRP